jgi:hypothetical protein
MDAFRYPPRFVPVPLGNLRPRWGVNNESEHLSTDAIQYGQSATCRSSFFDQSIM